MKITIERLQKLLDDLRKLGWRIFNPITPTIIAADDKAQGE